MTPALNAAGVFGATGSDGLSPYFDGNFGGSVPCLGGDSGGNFRSPRLGFTFLILEIFITHLLVISVIFFLSRRFTYSVYILGWESSVF